MKSEDKMTEYERLWKAVCVEMCWPYIPFKQEIKMTRQEAIEIVYKIDGNKNGADRTVKLLEAFGLIKLEEIKEEKHSEYKIREVISRIIDVDCPYPFMRADNIIRALEVAGYTIVRNKP